MAPRGSMFVNVVRALTKRKQTLAVVESSCGGLINASIMAVPGSSAVYFGGSVVYNTRRAAPLLPSDEVHARLTAPTLTEGSAAERYLESKKKWTETAAVAYCEAMDTDYAIAEAGATGPTFRPEGLDLGFTVLTLAKRDAGVVGQVVVQSQTADREANMALFTEKAGTLLSSVIIGSKKWSTLDRMSMTREDQAAVAQIALEDSTRFVVVHKDRMLFDENALALLSREEAAVHGDVDEATFLGRCSGSARFALECSSSENKMLPTRLGLVSLNDEEREVALFATALSHWQNASQFCASCGNPASLTLGGHARKCGSCAKLSFPRQDPAVIALVTSECGQFALLGHSPRHPPGLYTTLAGFVEVGETYEDAVRREVMEESGAYVTDVNYVASQAWPFPQSSMVGFTATADMSRPLTIDTTELLDGKWFSKNAIAKAAKASVTMDKAQTDVILANDPTLELLVPAQGAIARHLIETWLAG